MMSAEEKTSGSKAEVVVKPSYGLGDDEIASQQATVKWLRGNDPAKARQQTVSQTALAEFVVDALVADD